MQITPKENRGYCERNAIFFEDSHYYRKFAEISALYTGKKSYPADRIDGWAELVEEIIEGYNWCPPELHNDLDIARGDIDLLLEHEELMAFNEHKTFKKAIAALDHQFKALTFENKNWSADLPWFNRRILKKAGPEYVDFFDESLKYKIELIEE